MGLGETIGYGTRLSMNNSTLYQNQTNLFPRAIYVALMGDPTLRMDQVAPPGSPNIAPSSGGVTLTWPASTDEVSGYYVYRSASPNGPFARVTGSLVTGTTFSDTTVSPGSYTYMVRAVALDTTASGSYYNASQGAFLTVNVPGPILLAASRTTNGLKLSWNSQTGVAYRVQAKTNLNQAGWAEVSGSLTATGTNSSWTVTNFNSLPRRFYRIASP